MSGVQQYKCPNCGAGLSFNPDRGKFVCEYCKSEFDKAELDKQEKENEEQLRMAQAEKKTQENISENTQEAAREGVIYNCPSCGAEIVTDESTAATFCYYCHNPVVLSGKLAGENMPDAIIPFTISRDTAERIFTNWIKNKRFVPKSFYCKEQIDKMSGVYFPYHLYSCNIGGHVDGVANKTTVTRIGEIEETRHSTYHVTRDGNMELKNVTRDALSKSNHDLIEGILPYNMKDKVDFDMSYLSGFFAERKDTDKSKFETEVVSEVKEYAVNQLQTSLMGYTGLTITQNNTELVNEKWEYALLPVWSITYKSNDGKIYFFSINGQTGKTLGVLPIDRMKLIGTFLMIYIPIAIILLLIAYFIL